MIQVSLDTSGNNLWTLAAENGTVKIMNYLINILYSWPLEHLDRVLHFKTCHRENACMDIVKQFGTEILQDVLSCEQIAELEEHLNNPQSHQNVLREYLSILKTKLDKTIKERRVEKSVRRTLINLRKKLLVSDLQWHDVCLTGIISQRYPPNCIIVQKIIDLEIMCHEKARPRPILTRKNDGDQHIPKELKEEDSIKLERLCQNPNNENQENMELLVEFKEKEKNILDCIYNNVGKSPCTVEALDMAGETYPLTKEMPELKCSQILSILYFLLTSKPFWICLILFLFSFSLLTFDVYTDVRMVLELHQNHIHNNDFHCSRNTSNITKIIFGFRWGSEPFDNDMHANFWATILAVIFPIAGYFASWLRDDNLGWIVLKNQVDFSSSFAFVVTCIFSISIQNL